MPLMDSASNLHDRDVARRVDVGLYDPLKRRGQHVDEAK